MKILKLNAITLALVLLMVATVNFVAPALASYDYNVDVFVDGKQVTFPDQKPFIDNSVGRTYVPVRFVSEALGCNVSWDNGTQTANIAKGGTWVDIKIGSKTPIILDVDSGNEKNVTIDAPAMLVNNRTMVPLRFVSEALKANVTWKAPTQTGTGRGRVDVNQKQDAVSGNGQAAGKIEKTPDGGGGDDLTKPNETSPWPEDK